MTVLIIILLSMVVTRVATIALTLTGMSRQAARFQARSALTGAGYTTSESEAVVNHPVRRRIVMTLMLIGSAGIVTVIASVMLTFVNAKTGIDTTIALGSLVVGIGGLLLLLNFAPVDRLVSRAIRAGLKRYTDLDVRDYAALLEIHGGYAVSELNVAERDWIAGHTLAELRLNEEGVLVLGVQRAGGTYVGAPTGHTRVYAGDTLLLYGHSAGTAALDGRPVGAPGELQHEVAAADQRTREDHSEDPDAVPSPESHDARS